MVVERHELLYEDARVEVEIEDDGDASVSVFGAKGTGPNFGWSEWLELVEFVSAAKRMTS